MRYACLFGTSLEYTCQRICSFIYYAAGLVTQHGCSSWRLDDRHSVVVEQRAGEAEPAPAPGRQQFDAAFTPDDRAGPAAAAARRGPARRLPARTGPIHYLARYDRFWPTLHCRATCART